MRKPRISSGAIRIGPFGSERMFRHSLSPGFARSYSGWTPSESGFRRHDMGDSRIAPSNTDMIPIHNFGVWGFIHLAVLGATRRRDETRKNKTPGINPGAFMPAGTDGRRENPEIA
jgi:hypothetical protein